MNAPLLEPAIDTSLKRKPRFALRLRFRLVSVEIAKRILLSRGLFDAPLTAQTGSAF